MSKGSSRRPRQISAQQEELRWELMSSKTTPERKQEIKKILASMKDATLDNRD
jgi:hypothetical protein